MKKRVSRHSHRSPGEATDPLATADRYGNAPRSGMRRTALTGFLVGVALGCLFGAMMSAIPRRTNKSQSEMLSVNQRTGKPQLHIKGKPEIK